MCSDSSIRIARLGTRRADQLVASLRASLHAAREISIHAVDEAGDAVLRESRERLGAAGIAGNDQSPVNWGPPALTFSSGVAGLSSAPYLSSARSHARMDGRGTLDARPPQRDVRRRFQASAPGHPVAAGPTREFSFTGAATRSDVADFLLGLPHASSIAFGNPDKYFRAIAPDAYITDDWRLGPTFTANIGMRWEYEVAVRRARSAG